LELVTWKDGFSDGDRALIEKGLRHRNEQVLLAAIGSAVAHGALEPLVRDLAAREDACGHVAAVALAHVGKEKPGKASAFFDAAREEARRTTRRQALTRVGVMLEVRELRRGAKKETAVGDLELTDAQRMLLEYASMKDEEAVEALVATIQRLEVIKKPWSGVLASYGERGMQAALARLEKPDGVSTYGKVVLLRALEVMALCGGHETRARIEAMAKRYLSATEPVVRRAATGVMNAIAAAVRLESEER